MKRIYWIVLAMAAGAAQAAAPKDLQDLAGKVAKAMESHDAAGLDKATEEKPFQYFAAAIEDGDSGKPASAKPGKDGLYTYEKGFTVQKAKLLEDITRPCEDSCSFRSQDFKKLARKSDIRYEVVMERFCTFSDFHVVFIRKAKQWKLAGTFYETSRNEGCEGESQ